MIPFAEKTIKKSATPFNFPLTRSRHEGIILYWYIYLSKNGHHCGVIFYNFYLKFYLIKAQWWPKLHSFRYYHKHCITKVSFFWDPSQDMGSSGAPHKNRPLIDRPDRSANERPGFFYLKPLSAKSCISEYWK